MQATSGTTTGAQTQVAPNARAWWRHGHLWLLVLLAAQYVVVQLLTGAQYWDSPRNLHWGVYVAAQPGFLLNQPDTNNWVNGFTPEPASLAPAGLAGEQRAALHPWWGPLYPLLFAAVWRITGSYALLQLVVPLAASALVALTYACGARWFGRNTGLLGATLLALFPVFRDHAPLSFVEPVSALVLFGALVAFVERRTVLATLLGVLAMYGKIDLIVLYLGTAGVVWLLALRSRERMFSVRHLLVALGVPLLCLLPWLVTTYGVLGRPATVGGGPQREVFLALLPQMVEQLFTLPLLLGLAVLGVLVCAAVRGMLDRGERNVRALLGVWAVLGMMVLLVYSAMPGASNNPRVFIPTLPALCLLAARGLNALGGRMRNYLVMLLLVLFVLVGVQGTMFQILQARVATPARTAWNMLRQAPPGVVLTEHYWQAALFTQQPMTWFEHDPAFQHTILYDEANFRRYLGANPIRYVVLPKVDDGMAALRGSQLAGVYAQLPLGRELGWRDQPLTSDAVRAYLEQHFPQQDAGEYVIFVVRP